MPGGNVICPETPVDLDKCYLAAIPESAVRIAPQQSPGHDGRDAGLCGHSLQLSGQRM
jgi:hypothetical protein